VLYGPIGKEIGVSATPVREAIGRLASQGYVSLVPNLGAVVREPERDEIVELYEIRAALECSAVEKAALQRTDQQMEYLHELLNQLKHFALLLRKDKLAVLSPEQMHHYLAVDESFHAYIMQVAGNKRLLKMVRDLRILARIFRDYERDRPRFKQVVTTYRYHAQIVRAICNGDPANARDWMNQHINRGLDEMLHLHDKQHAQDGWGE
jgi:DNA-binding GntR family transcriptional regulator